MDDEILVATHLLDGVPVIAKTTRAGKSIYLDFATKKQVSLKDKELVALDEAVVIPAGADDETGRIAESGATSPKIAVENDAPEEGVPFVVFATAVAAAFGPFGYAEYPGGIAAKRIGERRVQLWQSDGAGGQYPTVIAFPEIVPMGAWKAE